MWCDNTVLSRFSALLIVLSLLNLFSAQEKYNIVYEGQNVVFLCDPIGPETTSLHYQWTLNDTQIIATGKSFNLRNVQKSDMGTYKCTVRGDFDSKSVVAEQSTFVFVKQGKTIYIELLTVL
ncbi:unnamed protein product [Dibothriocephalus latus]|uniref:Ig-like domain-containing protein n=1 Tax=Dibothriocephalus latus TaxID=60516 RepID=A0A3P7KZW2_DIBLA|nr:unnamed protein product [Dibothriocephalus latus]